MPALQQFFRDERLRRGWSVREAAQRSKISPSKAYAIENGDDNVEFETFENIATAFGLTPAELAVAIGKGRVEHDPAEAHLLALFRQIPEEHRPAAQSMLRGLAVPPTTPTKPHIRRSQNPSVSLDRHNEDEVRRIPSHRGVANRLFEGRPVRRILAKRVAA